VKCIIEILDPDIVEMGNVGRQLFSITDVGKSKAQALAERLRAAWGGRVLWNAAKFEDFYKDGLHVSMDRPTVVIGAVDNADARREMSMTIEECNRYRGKVWWLDCGNESVSGQVALGNIFVKDQIKGRAALGMINCLPAPSLLWPDLLKAPRAPKRGCMEALQRGEQGLMVNRMVAAHACAMLSSFLVERDLRYFAVSFSLEYAGSRAWMIDAETLSEVTGVDVLKKG
jgi:PRTRC genetic system ThiF family protein